MSPARFVKTVPKWFAIAEIAVRIVQLYAHRVEKNAISVPTISFVQNAVCAGTA